MAVADGATVVAHNYGFEWNLYYAKLVPLGWPVIPAGPVVLHHGAVPGGRLPGEPGRGRPGDRFALPQGPRARGT